MGPKRSYQKAKPSRLAVASSSKVSDSITVKPEPEDLPIRPLRQLLAGIDGTEDHPIDVSSGEEATMNIDKPSVPPRVTLMPVLPSATAEELKRAREGKRAATPSKHSSPAAKTDPKQNIADTNGANGDQTLTAGVAHVPSPRSATKNAGDSSNMPTEQPAVTSVHEPSTPAVVQSCDVSGVQPGGALSSVPAGAPSSTAAAAPDKTWTLFPRRQTAPHVSPTGSSSKASAPLERNMYKTPPTVRHFDATPSSGASGSPSKKRKIVQMSPLQLAASRSKAYSDFIHLDNHNIMTTRIVEGILAACAIHNEAYIQDQDQYRGLLYPFAMELAALLEKKRDELRNEKTEEMQEYGAE